MDCKIKFNSTLLKNIDRCYTVSAMKIDDKSAILYGSDGENSNGYIFYGDDFKDSVLIWENSGGCMSIKKVPKTKDEILVLQEFYLGKSPSFSKIIWYKRTNGEWESKDLYHYPFVHRMDVIEVEEKRFVIFATVAHFKKEKEDWDLPGGVYVFELPNNRDEEFNVHPIMIANNIHKNHGYYRRDNEIYISGEEGVFRLIVKDSNIQNWSFEQIYDQPTSDLVIGDIDGDGKDELIVIQGFHGNQVNVVKDNKIIYSISQGCEIVHGLTIYDYHNKKYVVIGSRKGDGNLFNLYTVNGEYTYDVIDNSRGPINVDSFYIDSKPVIAVANHTTNTAMIYRVEKE